MSVVVAISFGYLAKTLWDFEVYQRSTCCAKVAVAAVLSRKELFTNAFGNDQKS